MDVVRLTKFRKQYALGVLRHIRIIHIQAHLLGQLFGVTHAILLGQLFAVLTPAGNGLPGQVQALLVGKLAVQRLAGERVFSPLILGDAAQIFYDHAYRAHRVVGRFAVAGALLAKQAVSNGF